MSEKQSEMIVVYDLYILYFVYSLNHSLYEQNHIIALSIHIKNTLKY